LTVPIVILSCILGAIILALVLVLILVPTHVGDVCVKEVSAGEQPQCLVEKYDSEDAYVFSKEATTYQYKKIIAYNLPGSERNRTFKRSFTVEPGEIGFHNVTGANHSWFAFQFNIKLSAPADVLFYSEYEISQFQRNRIVKNPTFQNLSVRECAFTGNETSPHSLMIVNKGIDDVVVEEEGWIDRIVLQMDRKRALSVCDPGVECIIEQPNDTIFVVEYEGNEEGVPATILTEYVFNRELTIPLIQLPIFTVFVVAGLTVLWVAWCKSGDSKGYHPSTEQKIVAPVTPTSPTGPGPAISMTPMGGSITPNNTDPAPAPAPAPEFDPTLPTVREKDPYGLQI